MRFPAALRANMWTASRSNRRFLHTDDTGKRTSHEMRINTRPAQFYTGGAGISGGSLSVGPPGATKRLGRGARTPPVVRAVREIQPEWMLTTARASLTYRPLQNGCRFGSPDNGS